MQEPWGSASSVCRVEVGAEQVEVLAVAEVAEQQDPDVMVADRARGRPDPAREAEAAHPRAGADASLRDLGSEARAGPLDVLADDGRRIGHRPVIALPDHREDDVVRAPAPRRATAA